MATTAPVITEIDFLRHVARDAAHVIWFSWSRDFSQFGLADGV